MQIKLTKARSTLYDVKKDADSTVEFKFLDAQLLVNRVRRNPAYLLAHNATLQAGGLARYHLTRVELKTLTFSK
jgi:hypothetical protein